jgi:hypothetical protein
MEHINFLISVLSASAEDYPALKNRKRVVTASAELSSLMVQSTGIYNVAVSTKVP